MKTYALVSLIAALSEMKLPKTFLYNMAIGSEKCHNTSKFEVHTKGKDRRLAPFVGKYSDGVLVEKTGFAIKEYEPPTIKPFMLANADRILQQQFGQTIYGDQITVHDRKLMKVSEELAELDEMIIRRESWMVSKLLVDGIIPIIGEGVNEAISYGDANIERLTGESLWTDPLSDPIGILQEKKLEVGKETGLVIDTIIMSYDAYNAFQNHEKVKEYLKQINANLVRIDPGVEINGGQFVAFIPGLGINIYIFTDWYLDEEAGIEELMIPSGGVIGLRKGFINMNYGAIAQIPDESEEELLFVEKRVPHTWVKSGSNRRHVQLQSKPLPVPDHSRGWFTLSVI